MVGKAGSMVWPWGPQPGCPPSSEWRAKAESDLASGGSLSGVDSPPQDPERSLGRRLIRRFCPRMGPRLQLLPFWL